MPHLHTSSGYRRRGKGGESKEAKQSQLPNRSRKPKDARRRLDNMTVLFFRLLIQRTRARPHCLNQTTFAHTCIRMLGTRPIEAWLSIRSADSCTIDRGTCSNGSKSVNLDRSRSTPEPKPTTCEHCARARCNPLQAAPLGTDFSTHTTLAHNPRLEILAHHITYRMHTEASPSVPCLARYVP